MSHSEVRNLAISEMSKWGLIDRGWSFHTDNAISRHGQCNYNNKTISVTNESIQHNDDDSILNTIRHEIAHALHYISYLDSGNRDEYFARKLSGRKWVRKVPPHGAGWKKIARMVGVHAPKARAKSNVRANMTLNWKLVMVSSGEVVDCNHQCARFLKRLHLRYMPSLPGSHGNLYLIRNESWLKVQNGTMSLNDLTFFQKSNMVGQRFNHLKLAA